MLFFPVFFLSALPPLTDTIFFFANLAVLYSFYLQIYNILDKKKKKKKKKSCTYVCMYVCMQYVCMYASEWVCLALSSYS